MHHVKKLQEALGYKHRLYFVETVIMTNLDMEEVSSSPDLRPEAAAAGVTRRNKPRYVTARVTQDAETPPLFVTSCHLHYRAEPTRLAELAVMEAVSPEKAWTSSALAMEASPLETIARIRFSQEAWQRGGAPAQRTPREECLK